MPINKRIAEFSSYRKFVPCRAPDDDAFSQLMQDVEVPQVQLALQVPGDVGDTHEGEAPRH